MGTSLARLLDSAYPGPTADFPDATFRVLSSGDLADEAADIGSQLTLSLYLYRVTVNDHLRNVRITNAPEASPPLSLNLHYLMSAWSPSSDDEHTVFGWAMRHLHQNPILDGSRLMPDGGWNNDEVIHIVPDELTNEDLFRIWDSFGQNYRLSTSYIARVVVLEPDEIAVSERVIATRFQLDGEPQPALGEEA
ncbi:MAG: DUF4255 domain-containing protein [Myxococcota bacterium]